VLQFGQGIAPADVTVVRSGEDVIFKVGVNGDQVTFKKWFNESHGYYQPQQIKLADGTIWTQSQLNAQLLDMSGTAGNDSLVGVAAFAETLHGAAGNDTLTAVGDGDILDGGAGDDVLGVNGMPSGTTFVGGQGNDAITGSYLSDTYVFNSGDGQDTITDFNGGWTATDVLQLGPDIAADQIWFQKVGNNLQISIIGTTDSITVANWYSDARYHIEVIQLANGQKLLDSHVQNLVQVMGSLTLPSLGQTTLSADYQTQLEPTIAANWQ
jgi:Ca2+-binding RTX toxin-like protein